MGHKIDIMSFNPAEVATKLIMKDKSQLEEELCPWKMLLNAASEMLAIPTRLMELSPMNFKLGLWALFRKECLHLWRKALPKNKLKSMSPNRRQIMKKQRLIDRH